MYEQHTNTTIRQWRDEKNNAGVTIDHEDVTVHVSRSLKDGARYIQIDTSENSGVVRVELNDGPIWDADPETYDLAQLLERVQVFWSEEHDEPALKCTLCDEILCTLETGDTMNVLAGVSKDHNCKEEA